MKKSKQLKFFKEPLKFFGGRLLHGRRKNRRPLSSKDAIHLVMRSSWAGGKHSFLRSHHKKAIDRIVHFTAKRHGVRVYRKAIVSNHCHLVIRIHNRELYKTFIRVLSSRIASQIMGGKSFRVFKESLAPGDPPAAGEVQGKGQAFWQFRPFTRLLNWGKDFKTCCGYVEQNLLEALGFVPYKERNDFYAKWLRQTLQDPAEGFT